MNLYHGTPNLVWELTPRPSRVVDGEPAVFGAVTRDIALSFAAKWRDDDLVHGSVNGRMYMRERSPATFDRVFKRSGWILTVPAAGFEEDRRLCRFERICRATVPVLGFEYVPCVLTALRQAQFLLLTYGSVAPWEA